MGPNGQKRSPTGEPIYSADTFLSTITEIMQHVLEVVATANRTVQGPPATSVGITTTEDLKVETIRIPLLAGGSFKHTEVETGQVAKAICKGLILGKQNAGDMALNLRYAWDDGNSFATSHSQAEKEIEEN